MFLRNPRATTPSATGAWMATLAAAMLIDLAAGRDASLTVMLVFAPFVASGLASRTETAVAGAAATTLAVAIGWPEGAVGTSAHIIRALAVASGSILAVRLTSARVAKERRLRQVSRVAEIAQQAILHPLPRHAGPLELASLYVSATAEARIGGDFYAAVPSPWGTRMVVGDVRGKGLDAVRLAAVLLGEFRSRARTEPTLVDLVGCVETVAQTYAGAEDFATAIFLEVREQDMEVVRCGHPHPLVADRHGGICHLIVDGTLPLALGADPTTATTVSLTDRSRFLLYSDGAVETHDNNGVDFDLAAAFAHVATEAAPAALATILERLQHHSGGHIDDDVVLVIADYRESPAGGETSRAGQT